MKDTSLCTHMAARTVHHPWQVLSECLLLERMYLFLPFLPLERKIQDNDLYLISIKSKTKTINRCGGTSDARQKDMQQYTLQDWAASQRFKRQSSVTAHCCFNSQPQVICNQDQLLTYGYRGFEVNLYFTSSKNNINSSQATQN